MERKYNNGTPHQQEVKGRSPTALDWRRRQVERRAQTCVHFGGMRLGDPAGLGSCKLGIAYESVRNDSVRPFRWACTSADGAAICAKYEPTGAEAAERREQEIEARFAVIRSKIEAGICHVCDSKVETERQVGACVYAMPCGHRIGQGKAKAARRG